MDVNVGDNLTWTVWLFFAAQLLHGAGASPLFTLGVTYLDENVSTKMSSVYLGKFNCRIDKIFLRSFPLPPVSPFPLVNCLLHLCLVANEVRSNKQRSLRGYRKVSVRCRSHMHILQNTL